MKIVFDWNQVETKQTVRCEGEKQTELLIFRAIDTQKEENNRNTNH